jgi:hypothetical protein
MIIFKRFFPKVFKNKYSEKVRFKKTD